MKKVLLLKYGEIALRKGNRALFERKLAASISKLIDEPNIKAVREQGRLLVEDSRGDINSEHIIEKIRRIFGITAICVSLKLEDSGIEKLQNAAETLLPPSQYSFKVECKRSDKRYPMKSQEVAAAIGEHILSKRPDLTVDVRNPQLRLWVEIRTATYLYTEIIKCEAGLPYGSTGRGILLLSGGIDSPVAGYLMAKRGIEIIPIYFHSPPYTSERAKEKVTDIMERLSAFIGETPLHIVPFTETQLYIYEKMPPAKLTLFLKRAMLQIATMLAEKENAHCLITGDSVGQVASQTAQSIAAVDTATTLPILRPLAAMDKQSIINIATTIETYNISIRPYDDCCTIFVPKHPESKPNPKAIAKIESKHSLLQELYFRALDQVQRI